MKVRSSTRIAVGFVLTILIIVYGSRLYSNWRVSKIQFPPVEPGKVTLLGVDTGAGFKIVVANRMAQLREVSNESLKQGSEGGAGDDREDRGDGSTHRSRIPVRDMIAAMQGNLEKLSKFVMAMNDITDEKLPPERVYWDAADIRKALTGDSTLKARLVRDLNVDLDGIPLPELRFKSLEDGIVVRIPVPVHVNTGAASQVLVATVLRPYRPKLMLSVEQRYENKAVVDQAMRVGYYIEESKKVLALHEEREIVSNTLRGLIDEKQAANLAIAPEHVLGSVEVVVNDNMIKSASYRAYDMPSGKMYDLTVDLTSEGSDRLWKYSHNRVGAQLLLLADGIPIAAPRIKEELAQSNLEVKQLSDEGLVRQATDIINKSKKGAS